VVWSATNLADAFRNQGKHSEAEAMSCETLTVVRRVLGPERGGETSVVPRGEAVPAFQNTHKWRAYAPVVDCCCPTTTATFDQTVCRQ
jgi:hypothetical protein